MVRLVGLVLVPLAVAACVGETVGDHGGGLRPVVLLAALAVAALTVGRASRAAYLAERHWRTIASALMSAADHGGNEVTVVPHDTATAFAAGNRVVVSTALVDALEPSEVDAVFAHERAHLRGGHPRIAAWAQASTGPLGPHTIDFTGERLDCLALPPRTSTRADTVVATATGLVATIAVVVVCSAFHVRLVGVGLVVCGLAGVGVISVLRPLHRRLT